MGSLAGSKTRAVAIAILLVVLMALLYFWRPYIPSQTQIPIQKSGTATGATIELTSPVTPAAPALWLTYHRDLSRTGHDPYEPTIGSAHLDWSSMHLDGYIYAEPLVAEDRVIVATENDSVYALSVSDGRQIWKTHLGSPLPLSNLPCGNIDPLGITGTPAIDPKARTVYLVAFLQPGRYEAFALDLGSGAIRFHRIIDPLGFEPMVQQQRGALALSGGVIYVSFGGLFGDCGDYHGWIVGIRADDFGEIIYYKVPTGRAGGIWAPSGAAIDQKGNIYVATGNSFSTSTFDFGDSVIRLSPRLKLLDWFAPNNWADLNAGDVDLGSVGPAILDSKTIFQIGKEGIGYLLRSDALGGIGGQIFSARVCQGAYGGTAYANHYIYVPCTDGLVALRVDLASPSFSVAWRVQGFFAGPPIVAGGAVWTIYTGNGELYALGPEDGSVLFRYHLGGVAHFSTPSSGYGRLFVPAGDRILSFSPR